MAGCHVKPEQAFNLIFGYRDRWNAWLGGTNVGDGPYAADLVGPETDEIYVAQLAFIRNTSGARGAVFIEARDGSNNYVLAWDAGLARYEVMLWGGQLPLKTGDDIRVRMVDCLNGDVIEAGVWGYKMKLTQ